MNAVIRNLETSEIVAFHDLYTDYTKELAAIINEPTPQLPKPWYLDVQARVAIAIQGTQIVGFIIFKDKPVFETDVDAEILDIWVKPSLRKHGIGTALVKYALEGMHGKCGLQVHAANNASAFFWDYVLNGLRIAVSKHPGQDNGVQVIKYRFTIA